METPFDYLEAKINGISLSDAYKMGVEAGIKEVVEQVEKKSHRVATNMSGINLSKEDWEAIKDQLKEWAIQ